MRGLACYVTCPAKSDSRHCAARPEPRKTNVQLQVRFKWRTHLKAAQKEQDVLALIRAYMAEWKDEEIARLPPGAWPRTLESRKDVLAMAFRIGQAHSDFAGSSTELASIQELLLFITQASVRITQLVAVGETSPDPDAQVATEPEEPFAERVPSASSVEPQPGADAGPPVGQES